VPSCPRPQLTSLDPSGSGTDYRDFALSMSIDTFLLVNGTDSNTRYGLPENSIEAKISYQTNLRTLWQFLQVSNQNITIHGCTSLDPSGSVA
jgi:hypothetical protein